METSSQESQPDSVTSEDASPTRVGRGLRERKKVVYNEKKMAKKASTDSSDEDESEEALQRKSNNFRILQDQRLRQWRDNDATCELRL